MMTFIAGVSTGVSGTHSPEYPGLGAGYGAVAVQLHRKAFQYCLLSQSFGKECLLPMAGLPGLGPGTADISLTCQALLYLSIHTLFGGRP
jgi:hypothetical protein